MVLTTIQEFHINSKFAFEVGVNDCDELGYTSAISNPSSNSSSHTLDEETNWDCGLDLLGEKNHFFQMEPESTFTTVDVDDTFSKSPGTANFDPIRSDQDTETPSAHFQNSLMSEIVKIDSLTSLHETNWPTLTAIDKRRESSTSTSSSCNIPTTSCSTATTDSQLGNLRQSGRFRQGRRTRRSVGKIRTRDESKHQQSSSEGYDALRQLIPTYPSDRKMTKREILQSTIQYIGLLESIVSWQDSQDL